MAKKDTLREMIKAAFACDLTRLTGVEHAFEYRFAAPDRQWRADIAFPSVKVAIEIDGGLWTYGRHNRAASMLGDMEKGNGYAQRGWLVFHMPWEWIEGGRHDKSAELRTQIAAAIVANKKKEEPMMEFKTRPFVRWAGGKKQLLDRLEARMPATYGRYYEPFIGGGALLLDLQPERAVINDTNEQLLNVYRQLKIDAEAVIAAVNELDVEPCDKERYMATRDVYNAKIKAHELDLECAALMIWINKHCFNGLYRVNGKGLFNVSYINKKVGVSIDAVNLRNIGLYLRTKDVEIRQGDFEIACFDAQPGDFVYFDSPYVPIDETANFTEYTKEGFSLEDHKRLAALYRRLSDQGVKVMLSNHDVPLVHELYSGFTIDRVDVRRTINSDASKRSGKEVIITNY